MPHATVRQMRRTTFVCCTCQQTTRNISATAGLVVTHLGTPSLEKRSTNIVPVRRLVRLWHLADITLDTQNVRFRGVKRTSRGLISMSAYDQRTWSLRALRGH